MFNSSRAAPLFGGLSPLGLEGCGTGSTLGFFGMCRYSSSSSTWPLTPPRADGRWQWDANYIAVVPSVGRPLGLTSSTGGSGCWVSLRPTEVVLTVFSRVRPRADNNVWCRDMDCNKRIRTNEPYNTAQNASSQDIHDDEMSESTNESGKEDSTNDEHHQNSYQCATRLASTMRRSVWFMSVT